VKLFLQSRESTPPDTHGRTSKTTVSVQHTHDPRRNALQRELRGMINDKTGRRRRSRPTIGHLPPFHGHFPSGNHRRGHLTPYTACVPDPSSNLLVYKITHGTIDVKKRSNKNLKKRQKRKKRDKIKKPFVSVIKKTLPLLSVVQLHAWCPRNGLQGNSEYAMIQFSFAETVVVSGYQWNLQYGAIHGLFRCCNFESASC